VNLLRPVWILVAHDLRRRWRSILIWGVALGAVGALYVGLYPSMSEFLDELLEEAPESLKRWMGSLGTTMTVEQWVGMKFLNLFIPVALPFLAMSMGARTVAGNEERRSLDLLLSNPLRRWQVILAAVGSMALSLLGIFAITWVLTYIAVPIAGIDLPPERLAAALMVLWPFCLLFGAFALLLSSLIRRSFLAITIPAVVLVAMYLIESLAQSIKSVEPLRVVSLFYYLGHPIDSAFPWLAWVLMAAGACILTGGAVVAFSRRDIYT
jgi:ABC-2 type transport system permease protein